MRTKVPRDTEIYLIVSRPDGQVPAFRRDQTSIRVDAYRHPTSDDVTSRERGPESCGGEANPPHTAEAVGAGDPASDSD